MSVLSKRSTIYFDPDVHSALKMKSASTDSSISELVDEAIRLLMQEDQEDLADIKKRVNEPEVTYEAMLNSLVADGKL